MIYSDVQLEFIIWYVGSFTRRNRQDQLECSNLVVTIQLRLVTALAGFTVIIDSINSSIDGCSVSSRAKGRFSIITIYQ